MSCAISYRAAPGLLPAPDRPTDGSQKQTQDRQGGCEILYRREPLVWNGPRRYIESRYVFWFDLYANVLRTFAVSRCARGTTISVFQEHFRDWRTAPGEDHVRKLHRLLRVQALGRLDIALTPHGLGRNIHVPLGPVLEFKANIVSAVSHTGAAIFRTAGILAREMDEEISSGIGVRVRALARKLRGGSDQTHRPSKYRTRQLSSTYAACPCREHGHMYP